MAPGYRTATTTRRGNRGAYAEHDDFEGLPVRQWRLEQVNVAPPLPAPEKTRKNDRWSHELPHGLPKDWTLLPPHSQDLLRAARSGRLYKRSAPGTEEEETGENAEAGDKGEKKDDSNSNSLMVRVWKQVPRNTEGATVSHLAKRHKNTVTMISRAAAAQAGGGTVTRAKVRKLDAAGNPYEQTITLAEGQVVDGEIISTTVVAMEAATTGNTVPQQATPMKRRPPPPKRKGKGPGRGRKKGKLPLPNSTRPLPAAPDANGLVNGQAVDGEANGAKTEDEKLGTPQEDSEMAETSALPSDEEDGDEGDDDGDEGEGEGEDGLENGEDGGEDQTPDRHQSDERDNDRDNDLDMDETPETDVIQPSSVEEPSLSPPPSGSDDTEDITISKRPLQPLNPLSVGGPRLSSPKIQGSPLKNVIMRSPTDASPGASPVYGSFPAPPSEEKQDEPTEDTAMDVDEPVDLVSAASAPVAAEETTTDTEPIVPDSAEAVAPSTEAAEPPADVEDAVKEAEVPSEPPVEETPVVEALVDDVPAEEPPAEPVAPPTVAESVPAPVDEPATEGPADDVPVQTEEPAPTAPAENEDEGPDLLGGLERELDRQAETSVTEEATAQETVAEAQAPEEPPAAEPPVTEAPATAAAEDVPEKKDVAETEEPKEPPAPESDEKAEAAAE